MDEFIGVLNSCRASTPQRVHLEHEQSALERVRLLVASTPQRVHLEPAASDGRAGFRRRFNPTTGSSGTRDDIGVGVVLMLQPHNGFIWNKICARCRRRRVTGFNLTTGSSGTLVLLPILTTDNRASTPQRVHLEPHRSTGSTLDFCSLQPHNGFIWNSVDDAGHGQGNDASTPQRVHLKPLFWPSSRSPRARFNPTTGSSETLSADLDAVAEYRASTPQRVHLKPRQPRLSSPTGRALQPHNGFI